MARIRIAKATSGAAFVNKKKATEARLAAVEAGQEVDDGPEDIFELQHHHLLRCLEKTTVGVMWVAARANRVHSFCRIENLSNSRRLSTGAKTSPLRFLPNRLFF